MRPYGAAVIALSILVLGGLATWYAAEYFFHATTNRERVGKAPVTGKSAPSVPPWEQDVLEYFDDAAEEAKGGNINGAEMQVDQAVAAMEQARVRSRAVPSNFFGRASTELDNVLKAHPASEFAATNSEATDSPPDSQDSLAARLFQHVAQARVELAAMRSWQELLPAGAELAVDVAEGAVQNPASDAMPGAASPSWVSVSGKLRLPAGHIDVEAPRNLSKRETLDRESLHASFLDASLMSDTSEILLPPESRQLADNVRVENLTIAGASQTLDGIHWRNVTFISTRLRYEDGPLDLQNVRFIHCTFGFPSDARGAALASVIALGKTSLAIQ